MTDRLAELRRGERLSAASADLGEDGESSRILARFEREAAAIEGVLDWAEGVLGNAPALADLPAQLDAVEAKLGAVRTRLQRLARGNPAFAREHRARPATVRVRLARYGALARGLLGATARLRDVRGAQRAALARGLRADVLAANPRADPRAVDDALAGGAPLDAVLADRDRGSAAARRQVADIQARNADVQRLAASMAALNDMFQEMTILVEAQQEVINNAEFDVAQVARDVEKAADHLSQAHSYQKSARKKKICIFSIIAVILLAILGGVIAYLKVMCIIPCRVTVTTAPASAPAPTPAPAPVARVFSRASAADIAENPVSASKIVLDSARQRKA